MTKFHLYLCSRQFLFFVLPLKIFCNHASSLKSRAPSCANFLTKTFLIESQWLEPSGCRSSWSKSRNMVLTVLEIVTAKPLPCRGWAWIVIHFFSFVGMILLVCREALFGIRLREPARISFALRAAQVSLERVVTFPSSWDSFLPDSWRLSSNSLLDLTSALCLWISFTKRSVSLDITT